MELKFYRNADGVMVAEWSCPTCSSKLRVASGEDTKHCQEMFEQYPNFRTCTPCLNAVVGAHLAVYMADGKGKVKHA